MTNNLYNDKNMKKIYIQPAVELVVLSAVNTMMAGSVEAKISEDEYSGPAGSRQSTPTFNIWDSDDEEE